MRCACSSMVAPWTTSLRCPQKALENCQRAVTNSEVQCTWVQGWRSGNVYWATAAAHILLTLPRQKWYQQLVLYCSWNAVVKIASGPRKDPAVGARAVVLVGWSSQEVKPYWMASRTGRGVLAFSNVKMSFCIHCRQWATADVYWQVKTWSKVYSKERQIGHLGVVP